MLWEVWKQNTQFTHLFHRRFSEFLKAYKSTKLIRSIFNFFRAKMNLPQNIAKYNFYLLLNIFEILIFCKKNKILIFCYRVLKFDLPTAQGQEVEFHEIEIGDWITFWSWDRIILPVFMRSKLQFFIRSNSKPNLTWPNLT